MSVVVGRLAEDGRSDRHRADGLGEPLGGESSATLHRGQLDSEDLRQESQGDTQGCFAASQGGKCTQRLHVSTEATKYTDVIALCLVGSRPVLHVGLSRYVSGPRPITGGPVASADLQNKFCSASHAQSFSHRILTHPAAQNPPFCVSEREPLSFSQLAPSPVSRSGRQPGFFIVFPPAEASAPTRPFFSACPRLCLCSIRLATLIVEHHLRRLTILSRAY